MTGGSDDPTPHSHSLIVHCIEPDQEEALCRKDDRVAAAPVGAEAVAIRCSPDEILAQVGLSYAGW